MLKCYDQDHLHQLRRTEHISLHLISTFHCMATLNMILQSTCEHRKPSCVAYLDFRLAFDCVEILLTDSPSLWLLRSKGVPEKILQLLETYTATLSCVRVDGESYPVV